MAKIWVLTFRFIYFSHTQWENGEIENFVRELEKLGFSLEKTQSWSFFLLVVVAIFACKRDIVKKHDVYAEAPQINFGETELEHLNIYKSIFVKQNLDIWTFANPFLCNGIWADLKGLHLLKLLRTRWMERRGDRFRNHQHLNILWWYWEMKKSTNSSHIFSCPGQLNNWHCLSVGPSEPTNNQSLGSIKEWQKRLVDTSRH